MAVREVDIGMVTGISGRISCTVDLGHEIWVKSENQINPVAQLMRSAAQQSIGLFGSRVFNALRREKILGHGCANADRSMTK